MNVKKFQDLYKSHTAYWDERRSEMRRLRNAYANRYWDKDHDPAQVLIEVP